MRGLGVPGQRGPAAEDSLVHVLKSGAKLSRVGYPLLVAGLGPAYWLLGRRCGWVVRRRSISAQLVEVERSAPPGSLHHRECLIGSLMQACPGGAGRCGPLIDDENVAMSSQAAVHSIDELKNFRVALALYGEDTLGTLGAVEAEVRRTLRWLEEERPAYWHDQIKKRREQVAMARAEVFRKNLQKRPDYNPPMSEQKEALRKAEASLQDAEKRLVMVRKWQPTFRHAVLEYHASVQRLKDMAAGDVPSGVNLLTRIIDALEAYLRVAPPSDLGLGGESPSGKAPAPARLVSIATKVFDEHAAAVEAETAARLEAEAKARAQAESPLTPNAMISLSGETSPEEP